jgi:mono/diheme cytochrome c family protein
LKKTLIVAFALLLVLVPMRPAASAPDGKALYASKCAMCHGPDGIPKKTAAGSKAFGDPAFKKSATAESIIAIVTGGKGKMKPVKALSPEEAMAIADHILAMVPAK